MGTIDRPTFDRLIGEADGLVDGPIKVVVLEEAVRIADLLGDVPLGFEARNRLIEAANFAGAPERALPAFAWCLAQVDRDPEAFSTWQVLWQYKWIIGHIVDYPQIPRSKIEETLADFALRVKRSGSGLRPVYKAQYKAARVLGDVEAMHEAFARWEKSPGSDLSDCAACDLDEEVDYLADCGRDEEAVERARPILDGSLRCRIVPHVTLAGLLRPLLRLRRLDEAAAMHLKGYRLISKNRMYLSEVGDHMEFLALTGNLDKGIKYLQTHLPWALETSELLSRFDFALAARLLLDRLRASGKGTVRLRLPSTFPAFEGSGRYDVDGLIGWFEADADGLARRFDDRDGNDAYARKAREARGRVDLAVPYPIKARRGKAPGAPLGD